MEVIGFAPSTGDFSGTRGERMKVAEMEVFTQTTCNVKLEQKLINHEECKNQTFQLLYFVKLKISSVIDKVITLRSKSSLIIFD